MIQTLFLQPMDILILRANKLFGDAGSYGESMALPWPSVVAGAIRSRLMADYSLAANTWLDPRQFTLTSISIAQMLSGTTPQPARPLPTDAVVKKNADGSIRILRLKPHRLHSSLHCSGEALALPILAEKNPSKAESGYFLNSAGWATYLAEKPLDQTHLIKTSSLWKMDSRIGVGLNEISRAADNGKLFTTQAVAFETGTGFIVRFCSPHRLNDGLLRLGGDGRAAQVIPINHSEPEPDYEAISRSRRFRFILTTPGIFPGGWKLPGMGDDDIWHFHGGKARVLSAAVPRAEVISGWDLVKNEPKPAQRVAPTGSVYWLELLEGNVDALRNISSSGLWDLPNQTNEQTTDAARRAEGYNRCALANWTSD